MNPSTRLITLAAGLLGFLGVALGALGAHGLKPMLVASGQLEIWEKAVFYQMIHAVALLALASRSTSDSGPSTKVADCWVSGVVFFFPAHSTGWRSADRLPGSGPSRPSAESPCLRAGACWFSLHGNSPTKRCLVTIDQIQANTACRPLLCLFVGACLQAIRRTRQRFTF